MFASTKGRPTLPPLLSDDFFSVRMIIKIHALLFSAFRSTTVIFEAI